MEIVQRVNTIIDSIPKTVKGFLVMYISKTEYNLLCEELGRTVKSIKGIKVIPREDVQEGNLYCGNRKNIRL